MEQRKKVHNIQLFSKIHMENDNLIASYAVESIIGPVHQFPKFIPQFSPIKNDY